MSEILGIENDSPHLALARKYRPQKFEDVVGQEHVVNAFKNSISHNRVHHAYLLTGTRGIGKTTIARIFAKAINCVNGPTATPCGVCDACVSISEGVNPDVIEIDAASQTKVEDTRSLLDQAAYPPIKAKYKIFIIDEVHMLTTSSFNALLKTLEEPPAHVKFVLATTDPHKIPATVLSRCLQFQLSALNMDQIKHQLKTVCEKENISVDERALPVLARAARGSMRDALSLCDQAIALGNNQLTEETVLDMLGTVGDRLVREIFNLLIFTTNPANPDAPMAVDGSASIDAGIEFSRLLKNIREKAPNYKSLLEELVTAFHDLALYQLVGRKEIEIFSYSPELLENYSRNVSPEQVQLYYQIVLEGLQEYQYASDGRSAFEMTLLRLLAFTPEKKKIG